MQESALKIKEFPQGITDQHGRTFDYLRIAVIENCNLRCIYCMPEKGVKFQPRQHLMSTSEILRIVRIAADMGVKKIRFTGGEPLLRPDITDLVSGAVRTDGIRSVHLTTNGLLLDRYLDALKMAGLHGLNISLDTFKGEKFEKISRRTGLEKILENLYRAIDLDFPSTKLNTVLMRGFNEDEIFDFVELTREHPVTVRFIELMPFDAHQIWKTGHFFGVDRMLEQLRTRFSNLQTAQGSSTEYHIFRIPGYRGKVALIPSYTRSLCATCSRIRLTADGKIRNCLYSEDEFDLLSVMRSTDDDRSVGNVLRTAMWEKKVDGWTSQKSGSLKQRNSMTQIGG